MSGTPMTGQAFFVLTALAARSPTICTTPHLITVSLAELLILAAAVALITPDAASAQTAVPTPPPHPHPV